MDVLLEAAASFLRDRLKAVLIGLVLLSSVLYLWRRFHRKSAQREAAALRSEAERLRSEAARLQKQVKPLRARYADLERALEELPRVEARSEKPSDPNSVDARLKDRGNR